MMPDAPIRVIVADDQAMVRGALAALLDLAPDITVVAQAANGRELVEAVDAAANAGGEQGVDVVLTDIEMPVMDGVSAAAHIRASHPEVRVLVVTTFGRPGYVQRALDSGVSGFIVKDAPPAELFDAVRRVAQGLRVIDPQLAVETLTRGASPLTEREGEVLRAVAAGGTLADVAEQLFLSQGTVRNYVSAAMAKTGARTRGEAVKIAQENGWL
jgi:Response regulator containing a CheY-like receiver domain and an HTH DNA-binding domain